MTCLMGLLGSAFPLMSCWVRFLSCHCSFDSFGKSTSVPCVKVDLVFSLVLRFRRSDEIV